MQFCCSTQRASFFISIYFKKDFPNVVDPFFCALLFRKHPLLKNKYKILTLILGCVNIIPLLWDILIHRKYEKVNCRIREKNK